MTWPPRAQDNRHPDPIPRCAWCNVTLAPGEGNQQGKDHICDDCIEEVHGKAAWDRVVP